jgi:hypothetical protein
MDKAESRRRARILYGVRHTFASLLLQQSASLRRAGSDAPLVDQITAEIYGSWWMAPLARGF